MNPGLGGHDVPLEGKSGFMAGAPEGFLGGSDGNASACNAGNPRVQPLGLEDPLEEEMANHSSILACRVPMDRGAWQATVHRVAQLKQLSTQLYILH